MSKSQASAQPQVDDVVALYIRLRGEKERIINEAKVKVQDIDLRLEKLEAYLLTRMTSDGVTQYKTPAGTAFKTSTDHAGVADWEKVIEFVKKNDAFHLLEKRVSKTAVRSYLDDSQPLPPGINYFVRQDVQIRKPNDRD